jgi:transcriptional regulator with XRE-family HTH domain
MPPKPKHERLEDRVRAARKARCWSQEQLALKAGVGGVHRPGRIKSIQRIERGQFDNMDVVRKVLLALGLDEQELEAALPKNRSPRKAEAEKASPRRRRRRVVVDGQECFKALMALRWQGWRHCGFKLDRDVGDDDGVDAALLKVCGWVDRFRALGNGYERASQGHPNPQIPYLSCTEHYEVARDIRKAANVLRRHGWRLELADEWIDFDDDEPFLTRTFYVSPTDATKVDRAKA